MAEGLYRIPTSPFKDSVVTNKYTILQRDPKSEKVEKAQEKEQKKKVATITKVEPKIEISEEERKGRNAAKMAGNIRTASKEKAVLLLECWVPKHWKPEATEKTVMELKTLKLQSTIRALIELRNSKVYKKGPAKNELKISGQIITTDDQRTFQVQMLLDSGCTGSCIDEGFVRAKGITTNKIPRPIPVYNADGTLNGTGSIKEIVHTRMIIQEHVELISFGVTQLGKDKIFLGYDWLNAHNPTIDWKKQTLEFSQCPDMCKPSKGVKEKSPNEDEEEEGLMMRRMTGDQRMGRGRLPDVYGRRSLDSCPQKYGSKVSH